MPPSALSPPDTRRIILATLNARYIHCAFGLRYLLANMGELQPDTAILEFQIQDTPDDVAERLLSRRPAIIGLGIYIWNVDQTTRVVSAIKRIAPATIVVLGGPEVSHEAHHQKIVALSDYVIQGEGDLAFAALCRDILTGRAPEEKLIRPPLPPIGTLELPYRHYSDADLAHRTVYVEASRGCPFSCEFCLSSLDERVRQFPLEPFLEELDQLFRRGARLFKFVDRTFNLKIEVAEAILGFFRERMVPELFLHFEMIPDRLPDRLRHILAQFPAGMVQLEIGIQSFTPEVNARIQRRQSIEKLSENIRFLRSSTGCHLHADLIAGLPGETLEQFATGFDTLLELSPHEIQVGILKRLRGTPISRHQEPFEMVFSEFPPYEVLATSTLDFPTLQRVKRFARYFDQFVNSGNFLAAAPLLWQTRESPFFALLEFSDWLYTELRRTHSISTRTAGTALVRFLIEHRGIAREEALGALEADCERTSRHDYPLVLRDLHLVSTPQPHHINGQTPFRRTLPKRQQRHTS